MAQTESTSDLQGLLNDYGSPAPATDTTTETQQAPVDTAAPVTAAPAATSTEPQIPELDTDPPVVEQQAPLQASVKATKDVREITGETPERDNLLNNMVQGFRDAMTGYGVGVFQVPAQLQQGVTDNVRMAGELITGATPWERRTNALLNDTLKNMPVDRPVTDKWDPMSLIHEAGAAVFDGPSLSDFTNYVNSGEFAKKAQERGFTPEETQGLQRDMALMFQDPTTRARMKAYTVLSGTDLLKAWDSVGKQLGGNDVVQDITRTVGAFGAALAMIKAPGEIPAGLKVGQVPAQALNTLRNLPTLQAALQDGVAGILTHPPDVGHYMGINPNDNYAEMAGKAYLQQVLASAIIQKVGAKAINFAGTKAKEIADALQLSKFLQDAHAKGEDVVATMNRIIKQQANEPAPPPQTVEDALNDLGFPAAKPKAPAQVERGGDRRVTETPVSTERRSGTERRSLSQVVDDMVQNNPAAKAKLDAKLAAHAESLDPEVTVTATKGDTVEHVTFKLSEMDHHMAQLEEEGYHVDVPDGTPVKSQVTETPETATDVEATELKHVESPAQEVQPPTAPAPTKRTINDILNKDEQNHLNKLVVDAYRTGGNMAHEGIVLGVPGLGRISTPEDMDLLVSHLAATGKKAMEDLKAENPEQYKSALDSVMDEFKDTVKTVARATGQDPEVVTSNILGRVDVPNSADLIESHAHILALNSVTANLRRTAAIVLKSKGNNPAAEQLMKDQMVLAYEKLLQLRLEGSLRGTMLQDLQNVDRSFETALGKFSGGDMRMLAQAVSQAKNGNHLGEILASAGKTYNTVGKLTGNWVINSMLLKLSTLNNIFMGNTILAVGKTTQRLGGAALVGDAATAGEALGTSVAAVTNLNHALSFAWKSFVRNGNAFTHSAEDFGTHLVGNDIQNPILGPVTRLAGQASNSASRLISALDGGTTAVYGRSLLYGKTLSQELRFAGINNHMDLLRNLGKLPEVLENTKLNWDAGLNPDGSLGYTRLAQGVRNELQGITLTEPLSTARMNDPNSFSYKFMEPLEAAIKGWDRNFNSPIATIMVPFTRAAAHLMALGERQTVGVPLDAVEALAGRTTRVETADTVGRGAVLGACTFTGAVLNALMTGHITGPGPRNPKARQQLEQEFGYKPNSIVSFGTGPNGKDEYIPYGDIPGLGQLLTFVTGTAGAAGKLHEGDQQGAYQDMLSTIADSLQSDRFGTSFTTWMDALSPFLEGNPAEGSARVRSLIANRVATAVVPGIAAADRQGMPRTQRRSDLDFGGKVQEELALRTHPEELPHQYNIFGEPTDPPVGTANGPLAPILRLKDLYGPAREGAKHREKLDEELEKHLMNGNAFSLGEAVALRNGVALHLHDYKDDKGESAWDRIQQERATFVLPRTGMTLHDALTTLVNSQNYQKGLSKQTVKSKSNPNRVMPLEDQQWTMINNLVNEYDNAIQEHVITNFGHFYKSVGDGKPLDQVDLDSARQHNALTEPDAQLRDAMMPQAQDGGEYNQPSPPSPGPQTGVPSVINALQNYRRK